MEEEHGGLMPPEYALLEEARERAGLSKAEAAKRAGISATYWRAVVGGNHRLRDGKSVPTRAAAQLIADMAIAVRLDPDLLDEADRNDAAGLVIAHFERYAPGVDPIKDAISADDRLTDELKDLLLNMVDAVLRLSPRVNDNGESAEA